ncbi:hypothetical protein EJ05DRAFT_507234 [Pseudovirgaria hyperparasitica]|uniref:Uncharacterized protein n=1 Tax=Pseudovirgaria hyperparasitica TaxID=470096 RepID=A0A6A6WJN2_9PEZI|nr:uncharacterized protein EJ05DRAFT_507234 [Pseudovirgaria hyperparasitica]KAF2761581.1 hypothetical protein EJ05DRAFT_507234 [Pseudovirgaria hyperparasitica]
MSLNASASVSVSPLRFPAHTYLSNSAAHQDRQSHPHQQRPSNLAPLTTTDDDAAVATALALLESASQSLSTMKPERVPMPAHTHTHAHPLFAQRRGHGMRGSMTTESHLNTSTPPSPPSAAQVTHTNPPPIQAPPAHNATLISPSRRRDSVLSSPATSGAIPDDGAESVMFSGGEGLLASRHAPGNCTAGAGAGASSGSAAINHSTESMDVEEDMEDGEIVDREAHQHDHHHNHHDTYQNNHHEGPYNINNNPPTHAPRGPRNPSYNPHNPYRIAKQPRYPAHYNTRRITSTYIDLDDPEGPRELTSMRPWFSRGRGNRSRGQGRGQGMGRPYSARPYAQKTFDGVPFRGWVDQDLPPIPRVEEWSYEKETAKLWAMDMGDGDADRGA